MPRRLCITFTLLVCFGGNLLHAAGAPPIFDGKTLNGWVQRGGKAKYAVEDGAIVGTDVVNTPNSFLCTEKEYGDFILELELKADAGLNSGVQVRSHCFDKEIFTSRTLKFWKG